MFKYPASQITDMNKLDKGGRVTTSIKIDPDLLKKARKYAIDVEKTFPDILEEALKEKLNKK